LGFSVLERFADRFPNRFVNMGVAEQNMTGVAAGLALSGKIVFTYSIANFPTLRCLEQLRNDICYNSLNVKVVAVGGGVDYGAAGYSHHAVEDFAILGSLPNMKILAPADRMETHWCTQFAASDSGPCYLRLGKASRTPLNTSIPDLCLGMPNKVRDGQNPVIFFTGGAAETALLVAQHLAYSHYEAKVFSMPFIKPINEDMLFDQIGDASLVVTIEDHQVRGGLGTRVAEILVNHSFGMRHLVCFGIDRVSTKPVLNELWHTSSMLDSHDIATRLLTLMHKG
jgi:transketolase